MRNHTAHCLLLFLSTLFITASLSVADTPLVADFPFDGDVLDASGNGNNGTFFGSPTATFTDGRDGSMNGAILFDGIDDYVEVTQNVNLPLNGNPSFTVTGWVKGEAQGDANRIFSEGSSTDRGPIYTIGAGRMSTDDNKLLTFVRDSNMTLTEPVSEATAFDNEWHHFLVADILGAGNNRMIVTYIDGVPQPSATYERTTSFNSDRTSLGAVLRSNPVVAHLAGALDDIQFYNASVRQVINLDDSGPGSLRQVVSEAQTDDIITFTPGLSGGTILLSSGQIQIAENLTIDASNLPNGLTINANQGSRIMEINPDLTVDLRGLTLTGGIVTSNSFPANSGGAIFNNNATLSLSACTLSGNSASGDGGAIYNNGNEGNATLSLSNCTLAGNSARFGGGIYSNGRSQGSATLSLNNCTLASNSADSSGGGIFSTSSLGSATLNLGNCTLTGNSAARFGGGGIFSDNFQGSATLNLSNCTLAGNSANREGGGIFSDNFQGSATLSLSNTILAGNTASTAPDLQAINISTTTSGMNILSSLEGSNLGNNPPNITIEPDPLLAPLGFYGGPTQTMHPLSGSPAILTGDDVTRTDQRGFMLTGPATIGAVKLGSITTVTDEASQRSALADSANAEGQIIRFGPNLDGDTITLTNGQFVVPGTTNGLFIDASSLSNGLTIDANQASRVMEIQPGAIAALHGLTLTGGLANGSFPTNSGGAIFNDNAILSLSTCTLAGNSASGDGGGIFSDGVSGSATLSLSACTLSGNSASGGGGIFSDGGFSGSATLRLSECTLSGNSAEQGGGIFNRGQLGSATLSLSNTILATNTASTGPDLREFDDGASTTTNGNNLISSLNGQTSLSSETLGLIVDSDPMLAPLGFYGGPTQTMPPLPGSPSIDAAGSINPGGTDQRGFPRFVSGALDIGSVEFQGASDTLAYAFDLDSDSDGSSNGLELAIGTDPLLADSQNEKNLRLASLDADGMPQFTFGLDNSQQPNITLRLMRSTDLVIFNHEVSSNATDDFVDPGSALLIQEDVNPPTGGRAFYRLEAVPAE